MLMRFLADFRFGMDLFYLQMRTRGRDSRFSCPSTVHRSVSREQGTRLVYQIGKAAATKSPGAVCAITHPYLWLARQTLPAWRCLAPRDVAVESPEWWRRAA